MKLQAQHQIEEINIDSLHSAQQLQAEHMQILATKPHFVKMMDQMKLNIMWILLMIGALDFAWEVKVGFCFSSFKVGKNYI